MIVRKPAEAQMTEKNLRPVRVFTDFFQDPSGSEIVELSLVLIPLIGFVFLILNIAWVCFAQECLQHAVQMGVRSAIVGSSQSGATSLQTADIQNITTVVQTNAMGFLAGKTGSNLITVQCFQPTNLNNPTTCSAGYVVEVSVKNVQVSLLGPVIGTNFTSVTLSANSSDIMEGSAASP